MKRILFTVLALLCVCIGAEAGKKKAAKVQTDREYWTELAYRMAAPVLENMAKGELQKNMKLELSPTWDNRDKKRHRPLAQFARR